MIQVDLINMSGEKAGQAELAEEVFNVSYKPSLVQEALVAQLASRREGNACTKTKGEVSGGGVKPWRQKGTGRARAGSNRSPLWRHGGTIFGPKPRSYEVAFPAKKRRNAIKHILTARLKEGNLIVLEALKLDEPKAKLARKFLKSIKAENSKTLVVVKDRDINLKRAFSNFELSKLILLKDLNVHDMLNYEKIVIVKDAADSAKGVIG